MMITASFCLSIVYCQAVLGGSSQARVARSAVEHLRDHGTYIIHFKSIVTEIERNTSLLSWKQNQKQQNNLL